MDKKIIALMVATTFLIKVIITQHPLQQIIKLSIWGLTLYGLVGYSNICPIYQFRTNIRR